MVVNFCFISRRATDSCRPPMRVASGLQAGASSTTTTRRKVKGQPHKIQWEPKCVHLRVPKWCMSVSVSNVKLPVRQRMSVSVYEQKIYTNLDDIFLRLCGIHVWYL
jgi:hypothetical protein